MRIVTKKKIKEDVYIFLPSRRHLAIASFVVAISMAANIYFIILWQSLILNISFIFLVLLFILLFVPVIRNQMLIISGNNIKISIYGRWHSVLFSENLYAIVVENDEIVSYRFKNDKQLYQISPKSYIESTELDAIFMALIEKQKKPPEIVRR